MLDSNLVIIHRKRRRSDDGHGTTMTSPTTVRHQSLPAIKSTHSIMSMKNILISPIQESVVYQKTPPSPPPQRLLPFPPGHTLIHPYHPLDSSKPTNLDTTKFTIVHPGTRSLRLSPDLCYSPSSCASSSPSQSYFHYHPHRHSS
jgi:hypothetical protein